MGTFLMSYQGDIIKEFQHTYLGNNTLDSLTLVKD